MRKECNEKFFHIERDTEKEVERFYNGNKAVHMCGFSYILYSLYHSHGERYKEFIAFVDKICLQEDYYRVLINDMGNGFAQIVGCYISDCGYACNDEICLVSSKIAKDIKYEDFLVNKIDNVPDNKGHILELWD